MTEESQGNNNNHNHLNNDNVQAEPPLPGVNVLRKQHEQVVKDCEGRIQHWKKVAGDYEALDERLKTLPDQLSYDVMVPFGPLAFMPGKMVHTNEVTVLLGDNWFAKCSAKQAQKIVDHRVKYVEGELDALHKTMKNFESRVEFTKGLEDVSGNKYDIREEVGGNEPVTKGKQRLAHKPNSKPKVDTILNLPDEEEENKDCKYGGVLSEEELWARLDQLEKLEEEEDQEEREELEKELKKPEERNGRDRMSETVDINGEDTSSSSSEEEKEGDGAPPQTPGWNHVPQIQQVNGKAPPPSRHKIEEEEEDGDGDSCLPTIYFSHTVEPKKVRINTGKNTTLKFSERKEQKEHSKRKKKNGHCNGHSHHEVHKITTPADIYRVFVDVRNGEPVPRKSILKSRSRENSVCSDTSESSAADFEERRMVGRSFSHDEHSDTSDGITEEDSPTAIASHPPNRFEAFSGTVVEKDPMPSAVPHLTIAPPALPTIPERKQEEVTPDAPPPSQEEPPKRVSKFKAARLQQK